ncbi:MULTISPECIES: NUDIX domain-containing protein [Subtercola]|uniref:NUDIX hydrolase n=1 Tax=Subtercola vilae TaxID=2056433 RepID=A0A4T2C0I6_9MICO|nr:MULTISPECIES: NUDIX hydrolase [Subtercola]MEA9985138.1 NUDIX hydrolase [Subtercola sp. RTI3]TIH37665.1 NUDIX hydrolase [Subtercola vilae]
MQSFSMRDGEDFVYGPDGSRHWGVFGAAGILVADATLGVLLQKRSDATEHGGIWSTPGGALKHLETAVDGAMREAEEECGLSPDDVTIGRVHLFDLGYWHYSTVVARLKRAFVPRLNWESIEFQWVALDDVDKLDLHPALRRSWHELKEMIHEAEANAEVERPRA